ncbi:hypothetical protein CTJ15_22440 [Roseomonas sp. FDAARGOS_362]|nr:hypothetical protein CTJ15_22440 [Roseomonas sp. FDAARGOS_362]
MGFGQRDEGGPRDAKAGSGFGDRQATLIRPSDDRAVSLAKHIGKTAMGRPNAALIHPGKGNLIMDEGHHFRVFPPQGGDGLRDVQATKHAIAHSKTKVGRVEALKVAFRPFRIALVAQKCHAGYSRRVLFRSH